MSIKTFNSLEITGSFIEVPIKEATTSLTRPVDKKRVTPLELPSKRSSSLLQVSQSLSSHRSLSQLSNQVTSKKNSLVSITPAHNDLHHKNYEDEIQALKKRIDELEHQLKYSQKLNKEKEKIIEELNKKLNSSSKQEQSILNQLNQKLIDYESQIKSLRTENESLCKQLVLNEDLMKLETAKAREQLYLTKSEQDNEIRLIKEEHSKEMKIKEEKLENLKKQIAGAFKDNSWERQLQIEELTKELKRVQDESELIKHKLKGYKNKFSDSCTNCASMHEKLEEKILNLRDKDALINDLANLMRKFQNQLNFQDELIKIVNTNKNLNESLTKLCFGLKQGPGSSAIRLKK